MNWNARRIFSFIMLLSAAITVYQLLSRPQPIARPQTVENARLNAQSFNQKLEQLSAPTHAGGAPAEVRFSSEEVSAEMAEAVGALPSSPSSHPKPVASAPSSPESVVGPGEVQVQDYQVKLEGNVARGQFLTKIAGKDIYVTLAGHLGSQDGYVTFDPTEFKVGDLTIPVSLLNSALQKKLAEQREQLKLPEDVASLRVEDGELVITRK
jgi:hypothetical protein